MALAIILPLNGNIHTKLGTISFMMPSNWYSLLFLFHWWTTNKIYQLGLEIERDKDLLQKALHNFDWKVISCITVLVDSIASYLKLLFNICSRCLQGLFCKGETSFMSSILF